MLPIFDDTIKLMDLLNFNDSNVAEIFNNFIKKHPHLLHVILSLLISFGASGTASAQDGIDFVPEGDQLALMQSMVLEEGGPELTITEAAYFGEGYFEWPEHAFRDYAKLRKTCYEQGEEPTLFYVTKYNPDNTFTKIIPYAGSCGLLQEGLSGDTLSLSTRLAQILSLNYADPVTNSAFERMPFLFADNSEVVSGRKFHQAVQGFTMSGSERGFKTAKMTDDFLTFYSETELVDLVDYIVSDLCAITKYDLFYEIEKGRYQTDIILKTAAGDRIRVSICSVPGDNIGTMLLDESKFTGDNDIINTLASAINVAGSTQSIEGEVNDKEVRIPISGRNLTSSIFIQIENIPVDNPTGKILSIGALLLTSVLAFSLRKQMFEFVNKVRNLRNYVEHKYVGEEDAFKDLSEGILEAIQNPSNLSLAEIESIMGRMYSQNSFYKKLKGVDVEESMTAYAKERFLDIQLLKSIFRHIEKGTFPKNLIEALLLKLREEENPKAIAQKLVGRFPTLKNYLVAFLTEERTKEEVNRETAGVERRKRIKEERTPKEKPILVEKTPQITQKVEVNYEQEIELATNSILHLTHENGEGLSKDELFELSRRLDLIYRDEEIGNQFEDILRQRISEGLSVFFVTGPAAANEKKGSDLLVNGNLNGALVPLRRYIQDLVELKHSFTFCRLDELTPSAYDFILDNNLELDSTCKPKILASKYRLNLGRFTNHLGKTKVLAIFTQHEHRT